MTNSTQWSEASLVTFLFTVKGFQVDDTVDAESRTRWSFRLVTDAFPCRETDWTEWTKCDAVPVGIGHENRHRIGVHGIPGRELVCSELEQHQECVVNKDKTVSFSRTELRAKEGGGGETFTVRLNHEFAALDSPITVDKATLSVDELRELKGYDAVIYFSVPTFFQKEIVVDPVFVGWHRNTLEVYVFISFGKHMFPPCLQLGRSAHGAHHGS